MDSGKERIPVWKDGERAGTAELERRPPYTWIEVRAPVWPGLWCAWAVGETGERRIGILEPRDGEAAIRRRASRQDLAPLGRIVRCEVRPVHGGTEDAGDVPASSAVRGRTGPGTAPIRGVPPAGRDAAPSGTPAAFEAEVPQGPPAGRASVPPVVPAALIREEGGRRHLSFPVEDGGPFPVPGLFCFARLRQIGGRPCWDLAFDREGRPVFWDGPEKKTEIPPLQTGEDALE